MTDDDAYSISHVCNTLTCTLKAHVSDNDAYSVALTGIISFLQCLNSTMTQATNCNEEDSSIDSDDVDDDDDDDDDRGVIE